MKLSGNKIMAINDLSNKLITIKDQWDITFGDRYAAGELHTLPGEFLTKCIKLGENIVSLNDNLMKLYPEYKITLDKIKLTAKEIRNLEFQVKAMQWAIL